jgi:hypothetical protein
MYNTVGEVFWDFNVFVDGFHEAVLGDGHESMLLLDGCVSAEGNPNLGNLEKSVFFVKKFQRLGQVECNHGKETTMSTFGIWPLEHIYIWERESEGNGVPDTPFHYPVEIMPDRP